MRLFVLIMFLLTSSLAAMNAHACGEPWDREGYIGGLFNFSFSQWENGRGSKAIPDKALGGTLIGGFRVNDLLAIELSYDYLQSRSKRASANQNEQLLGRAIPSHQETHEGKFNLKGWGVSMGLFSNYLFDEFQVFGNLGIASLKPKVTHTHVSTVAVVGLPEAFINAKETLTAKAKYIPKASIGFHYMIEEWIGIRGSGTWYNTSRFNDITNASSENTAKLKDTFMFSLGVLFFI
jgi:hypothetical protein